MRLFGFRREFAVEYSNLLSIPVILGAVSYLIIQNNTFFNGSSDNDMFLMKTNNQGNITSIFNIPTISKKKLIKVVDILGREIVPNSNTPFIEIYNDGSVEKKIIIE